jgi:hypothetical protein
MVGGSLTCRPADFSFTFQGTTTEVLARVDV